MAAFLQGRLKHQLWTIQCYPRYWVCILLVPTKESSTRVLCVCTFVDQDHSNWRRFYHQDATVFSVSSRHRAIWLFHVQTLQPMTSLRSKVHLVWKQSVCQYLAAAPHNQMQLAAVGSDRQLRQGQMWSGALPCPATKTPTASVICNISPIHHSQLPKQY